MAGQGPIETETSLGIRGISKGKDRIYIINPIKIKRIILRK